MPICVVTVIAIVFLRMMFMFTWNKCAFGVLTPGPSFSLSYRHFDKLYL